MGYFDFISKSKNVVKGVNTFVNTLKFEELKDFFKFGQGSKNTKAYLKSYSKNPLVYMVVNKISQTTASMPRVVYDDKGNEIENSELKKLIENPNSEQSQIEFNEEVNESLLLAGNAYILYSNDSELSLVKSTLHVLKPDNVEHIFKNNVLIRYDYTDEFGNIQKYDVNDVLHIKTSNIVKDSNNHYSKGLSPLEAGWIIIQSSNQKFEAEASIFKNRGIIGIISTAGDTPMLPEERDQMQKEYDSEMGGAEKFNKIKISSTKLNYMQTGMTPTDLKLLEGIVSSLRLICSLFGMPSVIFNDTANSSYNNYSTAVAVSYSDVYVPLANKIDQKMSSFLSAKLKVNEFIKVDSSKVDGIKQSTNAVAQALVDLPQLLSTSIVADMTQNERREIVGLEPKDGGDTITPINQPNTSLNI